MERASRAGVKNFQGVLLVIKFVCVCVCVFLLVALRSAIACSEITRTKLSKLCVLGGGHVLGGENGLAS